MCLLEIELFSSNLEKCFLKWCPIDKRHLRIFQVLFFKKRSEYLTNLGAVKILQNMDRHKINIYQEGSTSIKGLGCLWHPTICRERSSMKWQEVDWDIVPTLWISAPIAENAEKSFLLQALLFSHMSWPSLKCGRAIKEARFNVFFHTLSHSTRLIPQKYSQYLASFNKKEPLLSKAKSFT